MDNAPTLGFLLHDVARLLRKRFEQRARDLGLTRSQWQTLAYLNRNEGIHQSGLADILEIEPITLVRILDRLEERGLVERRRHPTDRRIWLLYLKDAARPADRDDARDRRRDPARSPRRPVGHRARAPRQGALRHEDQSRRGLHQPAGDKEAKPWLTANLSNAPAATPRRSRPNLDRVRKARRGTEPAPAEAPPAPPAAAPARPATPRRRILRPLLFALLPVALLVGGYVYVTGGQVMETDNAYVQADMVGVSTDVAGTVAAIEVKDDRLVEGDVLFRLKQDSFKIALEGAEAQLGTVGTRC